MLISDFTFLQVELSTMSEVFTSPRPLREYTRSGKVAGIDRGTTALLATNGGQLINSDEKAATKVKALGNAY